MNQEFSSSSESDESDQRSNHRSKRLRLINIDLSTQIGDEDILQFPTCLMNASGAKCTTKKELDYLMTNPFIGGVVSKSCTLNYRLGNPLPRYYHDHTNFNGHYPAYSINSTGLANLGVRFYHRVYVNDQAQQDQDQVKPSIKHKPYILSIAGLSLDENLKMLELMENDTQKYYHNYMAQMPDSIELNLSCPNVIGKPQIGYDFDASEEALRRIFELVPEIRLGLKLPPYFDFVHYDQMTEVIKQFPIQHITCINSLGNGLVIDWVNESTVIKPKGGFGGIGGSVVKSIALANVRRFSQLLPRMSIIGCGGVRTGWDAFEHILAGASMVQIGTQLMVEGLQCFERITKELKLIMQMKGYTQLSDFQGRLREI